MSVPIRSAKIAKNEIRFSLSTLLCNAQKVLLINKNIPLANFNFGAFNVFREDDAAHFLSSDLAKIAFNNLSKNFLSKSCDVWRYVEFAAFNSFTTFGCNLMALSK